jgi:phytoene dehydrogenase-like protein
LHGKFTNPEILDLAAGRKLKTYYSVLSVSMGISRTFEEYSHFSRFPLDEELISADGTRYSRLELHIYNYDPTLAPAGKTVVSVSFYTQNGEFWIGLRKNDPEAYRKAKNDFAEAVINILEKKIGNLREHIEEISVATPASFYRYTNNWKGSVQGWLPGKNIMAQSPVGFTLPGLNNFYFSSHWSIPGGGLPVAIKSAHDATQVICRKYGKKFTVIHS